MLLNKARLALAALLAVGVVAMADEKKDEEKGSIGIQVGEGDTGEVVIVGVFKNSPAEKAGIKAGDTLLKIDGKDIKKPEDGGPIMGAKKPGDKVKLTIKREGKDKEVEMTCGKRSEVIPPDTDKKPKEKEKDKS
ncbi:MAG TPA: PDZ domain-containing protein [Gemmataceae bacterium]|nr:PDZ domain-containing protein [Gemmataceae bacterium]